MKTPQSKLHYSIGSTPEIRIIAEADDYLIVDKPPFLLTHPTKPTDQPTLLTELRKLLAYELVNAGQVSIINRLDRETSGLVLVTKNSSAARKFGLLMQERLIAKEYLALIWGWPDWDTKLVDAPLDRLGKHDLSAIWLKQGIHEKGVPAQTEFRVEQRFAKRATRPSPQSSSSGRGNTHAASRDFRPPSAKENVRSASTDSASPSEKRKTRSTSHDFASPAGRGCREAAGEGPLQRFAVVRAIPLTGRTHQIRVHLSSLGYPVVGDKIYGPNDKLYLEFIETGWTSTLEDQLLLPRHALHSAKLAINGVGSWESELPDDLASFCSGGL